MRLPLLAGLAALLTLATSVATTPAARAAYIVTFSQVGSDVVASGSGTINVNGLALASSVFQPPFVEPYLPGVGAGAAGFIDVYSGTISGPSNFGFGSLTNATTGTGGFAAINVYSDEVGVPSGYVSGAPLLNTATYEGQSFDSLGLAPGSYIYSFGSGANADTFTVSIGVTLSVPEPTSLALLGSGLLGLGLVRRREQQRRRRRPGWRLVPRLVRYFLRLRQLPRRRGFGGDLRGASSGRPRRCLSRARWRCSAPARSACWRRQAGAAGRGAETGQGRGKRERVWRTRSTSSRACRGRARRCCRPSCGRTRPSRRR